MTINLQISKFGWFGAGWSVFLSETDDPAYYPPLNDIAAQREWLGGFGAAWVEYPDDEAVRSILYGDGTGGERVEAALARALRDKPALLRQLFSHRQGNQACH